MHKMTSYEFEKINDKLDKLTNELSLINSLKNPKYNIKIRFLQSRIKKIITKLLN